MTSLRATIGAMAAMAAIAASGVHKADANQERKVASYRTVFAGAGVDLDVETMQDRRFHRVVRQFRDYSCGSAALATLLTHHYDVPMDEAEVFVAMWQRGDQKSIRTRGFSLLDMKTFLVARGLLADGYELDLDRLAEVGVPAIALIEWNGYKHFVVVKGIGPDRVLLGDPSVGLVARSRSAFEASWDGTVFFIRSRAETGRAHFNLAADWQAEPTGPIRSGPGFRDLADDTLTTALPVDSAFSLFRGF